jgi:hypothetical protein
MRFAKTTPGTNYFESGWIMHNFVLFCIEPRQLDFNPGHIQALGDRPAAASVSA